MVDTTSYVPDVLIKVNGKSLAKAKSKSGRKLDLLSVSVTDTCDRADSFSVVMSDHHPQVERFAGGDSLEWIDSGLFDEGSEIYIELGYVQKRTFRFLGEITGVSMSFPQSGAPTLTLRGFSLQHRLQRKTLRKPFRNVKDSQIASAIAAMVEPKLDAKVDDSKVVHAIVSPNNATMDAFLKSRAQRIDYEVVVKEKTLYFQRPKYIRSLKPKLTLEWGRHLQNVSVNLSTYEMPIALTVQGSRSAHGGERKLVASKATAGKERALMGDKTGTQLAVALGGKPIIVNDHEVENQQDAKEMALARLEAKALGFIKVSGSCIGNPDLQARQVVELAGLGKRLSGVYYVTSTTHKFDANGYRTSFEMKRNARNDS